MDKVIAPPILTVLMPVFNVEKYISEAVESILGQSFGDFEFLIIDDASTDQTVALIESYGDSRIKLIQKTKNTGYTNSLNLGLKIAKGKYVARMDGDDISLPNRFARQISYLENNPEVIVCGSLYKIIGKEEVNILPMNNNEIRLALLRSNCLAHPSVMIRKDPLTLFSVFYDNSKEPSEDYDLWVRLLPLGEFHNLQEVLLHYRFHYKSVSRIRSEMQEKKSIEVKFKILEYLNISFNPVEKEVLRKVFLKISNLSYKEIEIFQKVKRKLYESNDEDFFEHEGFEQYLESLENRVLSKFVYRYERYSPRIFVGYLKIRNRLNIKLKRFEEINLFLKSILYWKNKKCPQIE